jgi:hypothetical protein
VEEMIEYCNFPVYIHFHDMQNTEEYYIDIMIKQLELAGMLRYISYGRKKMSEALRSMVAKGTAQITNLICPAHGSLGDGEQSIMQHVVSSGIAKELEDLYEEYGVPLDSPTSIVAQDPAYTDNDKNLPSGLPVSIRVVLDPEGFLAINVTSLVVSFYPSVPVKQVIAGMPADSATGKGPAAMLWNNSTWQDTHGGVDVVTYPWQDVIYYAKRATRRLVVMLKGYTRVMAGAEMCYEVLDGNRQGLEDHEDKVINRDHSIEALSEAVADLAMGDKAHEDISDISTKEGSRPRKDIPPEEDDVVDSSDSTEIAVDGSAAVTHKQKGRSVTSDIAF